MISVDWTKFDQYPENTVTCRCGATYRSHSRAVNAASGFVIVSRKPCPACGETEGNAVRASSDPETMTLSSEGRRE